MRTVIQRTAHASVTINGRQKSAIGRGMLILVGIEDSDSREDIDWLTHKIVNLRIFDDDRGVMNRSVLDTLGDILVVSQFTLHASTKKGNRRFSPSSQAMICRVDLSTTTNLYSTGRHTISPGKVTDHTG